MIQKNPTGAQANFYSENLVILSKWFCEQFFHRCVKFTHAA